MTTARWWERRGTTSTSPIRSIDHATRRSAMSCRNCSSPARPSNKPRGVLMVVYRIDADQAFAMLQWRSQQTNTKLRTLAAQVVAELDTLADQPDTLRRQFDHLLLTVHQRVPR